MRKKSTVVCLDRCYGITVEPLEHGLDFCAIFPKQGNSRRLQNYGFNHREAQAEEAWYVSTFISCFTVYFMSLVVLNR